MNEWFIVELSKAFSDREHKDSLAIVIFSTIGNFVAHESIFRMLLKLFFLSSFTSGKSSLFHYHFLLFLIYSQKIILPLNCNIKRIGKTYESKLLGKRQRSNKRELIVSIKYSTLKSDFLTIVTRSECF